jgi:hypothetical protein
MKICSIRISVLSIVFSLMFLIISTGTKTEAQGRPKNDLVSELRLELPGLLGPKSYSTDRKDLKVDPLRGLLLPLKEGLNAFIDGAPPLHQDCLKPKDGCTNYRVAIGFKFSLR